MRRPSFQFYPADWLGNSNLRRCSHAEKGAWVDVMCLLHDQAKYGVLRWPLKEIAQAVGCPVALLLGLLSKGVLKGDCWRRPKTEPLLRDMPIQN